MGGHLQLQMHNVCAYASVISKLLCEQTIFALSMCLPQQAISMSSDPAFCQCKETLLFKRAVFGLGKVCRFPSRAYKPQLRCVRVTHSDLACLAACVAGKLMAQNTTQTAWCDAACSAAESVANQASQLQIPN